MRFPFTGLAALLLSGCSRHLYTAPVPVEGPRVPKPAAAPPMPNVPAPTGTGTAAGADVVNYIIARNLLIPVAGMPLGRLQDTFDEGRDVGRIHRALDILAPRGTPVLSADSGRIIRLGTNALGGNIVYAQDPQGRVVYYYAHLDAWQPGLAQGAAVARGDTLGFVGTTGNAPKDTPHLHFQVMRMPSDGRYWDGDAINPYPLFLLMRDPSQP